MKKILIITISSIIFLVVIGLLIINLFSIPSNKEWREAFFKLEQNISSTDKEIMSLTKDMIHPGYAIKMPTYNQNGDSSPNYCFLTSGNLLLSILLEFPPTKNQYKVIDIGSGFGACAKHMALLGYKVFSVDKDNGHMFMQKINKCGDLKEDSFAYLYLSHYNPALIKSFSTTCPPLIEKNLTLIEGFFPDRQVIEKINQDHKQWDLVLALNSFQFMDRKSLYKALDVIGTNLKVGGRFYFIVASSENYEGMEEEKIHNRITIIEIEKYMNSHYGMIELVRARNGAYLEKV